MGKPSFSIFTLPAAVAVCLLLGAVQTRAEEAIRQAESPPPPAAAEGGPEAVDEPTQAPRGLVRLAKDYDVWVDLQRKLVVVDGEVCLREGQLEMFACPRGSKEHESIVAVNSPAQFVHAGLLALGAEPGQPVKFDPEYVPAHGTVVEVLVLWKDAEGQRQTTRAQQWIRNVKTGKSLQYPWVFAGSGFWTDEDSGQRHYHADYGDFICVSNFPTAMLDLPVASSQDNADLLFEAFTDRIPAKGTKVRLVLIPQAKNQDEARAQEPERK